MHPAAFIFLIAVGSARLTSKPAADLHEIRTV